MFREELFLYYCLQPAVDVSHLIDDEDILSDDTPPPPPPPQPPQPIEADVQLAGE